MSSSEPLARQFGAQPIADAMQSPSIPPLYSGDHLDQPTFHARYEAMPENFHAELVEGVVIVTPPVSCDHAGPDGLMHLALATYGAATAGTKFYPNCTVILGPRSEPQPDGILIIQSEFGGQTREERGYVHGAPELVSETAYSSESHDLHSKRRDYERAGVREYVIVLVRERRIAWFTLRDGRFASLEPDSEGIIRSVALPGLWLDPVAVLAGHGDRVLKIIQQGIQSPGHAAFVQQLRTERARRGEGTSSD